MPLVPDVISRLCSTVPTEMRHSEDIVQACPGGGPVIPNHSLAPRRSERKIRTQEFSLSLSLFFNECLIQNILPYVPAACLTPAFISSSPPSYRIDPSRRVRHVRVIVTLQVQISLTGGMCHFLLLPHKAQLITINSGNYSV